MLRSLSFERNVGNTCLNIHYWFPGELRSADEVKLVSSSDNRRFNFDKNDQEKLPPKSGSTASLEWDATQGQIYYNSVLDFFKS